VSFWEKSKSGLTVVGKGCVCVWLEKEEIVSRVAAQLYVTRSGGIQAVLLATSTFFVSPNV
jgi:hypothetical protein